VTKVRGTAAVVCALVAALLAFGSTLASQETFEPALAALAAAQSYDAKAQAASTISASGHPRAEAVLSALLAGELYTGRNDNRLVIASQTDGGYAIRDAASDEDLGMVGRRDVNRVTLNNQLRSTLRGMLATLKLSHPDARQRIAAIAEVGRSEDPAMLETLAALREQQTHGATVRALDSAIAVLNLDSADSAVRLAAIEAVAGNVDAFVRTKLTRLAGDAGVDKATSDAAAAAIRRIESKVQLFELIRTAFFGLSLGSILVLAAIGLSVTFGIMGVINMAHGELMMLGAYTTYVVQQVFPNAIAMSLFMAIPAAFLISGLVGIAIERGIVRFLYGRPLETLLATFGVSLLLQQSVRSIFSPLNRSVITPQWMSGSWEIVPGLDITFNRLYILVFSMIVFGLLLFVLRRTRLGLEMRAVTQNRAMAKAMGIRTSRIDMLTFGLGSGIAGVAGVALSQLTNVGPNLGQAYIVDSFMVVVFGGVGSLWGTLVSGLSLGVVSKLIEPAAGAVMAKIFVLIFLIIFIQKRPRGLFPQKGRAAEG
jgi:urea transport system permease protein